MPFREKLIPSVPERFRRYLPGIRYQPLNGETKEIRLLHFEPNTNLDDKDSLIRCRVENVSLQHGRVPAYRAISYCWGENPGCSKVILNGHKITVPASAEAAIRGTCQDSVRESIPIWIDAICIDQLNDNEKSSQVAFMGSVYSRAVEVLVWLGGDEHGTANTAIASIENFLAWHSSHKADDQSREESKVDLRQLLKPPFYDSKAVCDLADAPWFTRLWAVQEVVLATSAICYRGNHSISWARLSEFSVLVYKVPGMSEILIDLIVDSGSSEPLFTGTMAASTIKDTSPGTRDLSELLIMGRNCFKTSDPRDRVYGVLGLPSLDETLIIPDYKKSLKEVYTSATVATLRRHSKVRPGSRIRLLCEAQRAAIVSRYSGPDRSIDTHGCPSWVPRYDLAIIFSDGASAYIPPARASAKLELCFEYDTASPDVLRVKGCIVGSVEPLGPLTKPLEHDQEWVEMHTESEFVDSLDIITYASTLLPSYAEVFNRLWRSIFGLHHVWSTGDIKKLAETLIVGAYTDFQPAGKQVLADFSALALRYKAMDPYPADLPSDKCLVEAGAREGNAEAYFRRVCLFVRNRIPFVTREKGFIGMGPLFTETDDAACILYGSPTPLMMRREGAYWRLLGDTYVHGIMDGEYIEQLQANGTLEAETQWFDIH